MPSAGPKPSADTKLTPTVANLWRKIAKENPRIQQCLWAWALCALFVRALSPERAQDFVQHFLGIAKQHAVVVFVKQWVIHTGVTAGH